MNQYAATPQHDATQAGQVRLRTLAQDFFSLVLMIRRGGEARSVEAFLERVESYFRELEGRVLAAGYAQEQFRDAQYALCAFLDESVLAAGESNIRRHIELHPLQYKYFGVHLAGEGFFERLEVLRGDVRGNLDVLEVYHLCLALGFEGKYRLEHRDQLRYIANTLGQDIARHRKAPDELAPGWQLPDQVGQLLRHEVPVWVYLVLIALLCGLVYLLLDGLLGARVDALVERLSSLFDAS
ncbi:type IVB secretion system protein IcmH/DotU [Halomonas mongoliensis]|uniref:Type IVB secretion system protein IcmH/DotU n=1 Tax=Halomonas mongoliensis TaxID=321265 RepID=A0ABU1GQ97_9GAMM|nr:type IVB secretion system protein IcmH/DotU [Halomonas mongoliensis]MDR5893608.1 type IVB secretion system protein IcmH/DotU [Halomonas mongoliensis]